MTSKAPPPSLPAELGSTWLSPGPALPSPLALGPAGFSPPSVHASAHSGPAHRGASGAASALWDPAHFHRAGDATGTAPP
eukprot:5306123-Lingulodinium_polyedra.AAC.1